MCTEIKDKTILILYSDAYQSGIIPCIFSSKNRIFGLRSSWEECFKRSFYWGNETNCL